MAKFLVCDDAMFMRHTLTEILKEVGHTVVAGAATGAECINLYQRLQPDIVLMDITMPDMDGITATREIMKINPKAKIIMVSAMGTQDKVFEAISAGAKDFIVKPFEKSKFLSCIAKYV